MIDKTAEIKELIKRKEATNDDDNDRGLRKLFQGYLKKPELLEKEGIFSKIYQEIQCIQSQNNIELFEPASKYLEDVFQPIKTYNLLEESPFKILDDKQTMILRNGILTIGAKANTGKTSLATHLAIEIMKANEKTCFIFLSLDDARTLGIKRMISQIMNKRYMSTETFTPSQVEKDRMNEVLNHVYFGTQSSLEYIESRVNIAKNKYTNVIVCIDYLQLMDCCGIQRDKRNEINEILKRIKKIQQESNSLFIILSQMKRSDGKGLDYEFRETSEIENVSDVCMEIKYALKKTRENNRDKIEEDKASKERRIEISKNKIGIKYQVYTTSIDGCFVFSRLENKNIAPKILQTTIEEAKEIAGENFYKERTWDDVSNTFFNE